MSPILRLCGPLPGQAALEFGPIDILFNNAGMNIRKPFEAYTEEEFNRIISVHLKGMFFMAQAVYPAMVARRHGCIINVASQRALKGAANSVPLLRRRGCDHRVHSRRAKRRRKELRQCHRAWPDRH